MSNDNINIRVRGELQTHLQQQIGPDGLYDNASEYIRALIRRDLKDRREAWSWLKGELEPALRASPDAFMEVSAEDVIARNQARDG